MTLVKAQDRIAALETQVARTQGVERVKYTVLVYTATQKGAATTARVWLELVGDTGVTSGRKTLRAPSGCRAFARGAVDKFDVVSVDVGNLLAVRVGHDNGGCALAPTFTACAEKALGGSSSRGRRGDTEENLKRTIALNGWHLTCHGARWVQHLASVVSGPGARALREGQAQVVVRLRRVAEGRRGAHAHRQRGGPQPPTAPVPRHRRH
jgi:hypothetical protein